MIQACLYCDGDASAPNHKLFCDGRQGGREPDDDPGPFGVVHPFTQPIPEPVKTLDTARRERDTAIDLVEDHATDQFMEVAIAAIHGVALTSDLFIADDVWNSRSDWPDTRDRRAMGAVVRVAVRNEWIAPTEEFKPSARRHCTPMRVWKSLICSQVAPAQVQAVTA